MAFSPASPVSDETVSPVSTTSESTVYQPLDNMNVAAGSLTGTVVRDHATVAEFEVSKYGDFSFHPIGDPVIRPVANGSKLDRIRGKLTVQWDAAPGDNYLVVGYQRIDYSRGWAALFVTLGIVYLVSSVCWLFIDCTKTLDTTG
jgi:hypothetical protein